MTPVHPPISPLVGARCPQGRDGGHQTDQSGEDATRLVSTGHTRVGHYRGQGHEEIGQRSQEVKVREGKVKGHHGGKGHGGIGHRGGQGHGELGQKSSGRSKVTGEVKVIEGKVTEEVKVMEGYVKGHRGGQGHGGLGQ